MRRSTQQVRLGFVIDSILIKREGLNAFNLTPDRVAKELSARAKSLSKSRECFIKLYIDNQCLIIII